MLFIFVKLDLIKSYFICIYVLHKTDGYFVQVTLYNLQTAVSSIYKVTSISPFFEPRNQFFEAFDVFYVRNLSHARFWKSFLLFFFCWPWIVISFGFPNGKNCTKCIFITLCRFYFNIAYCIAKRELLLCVGRKFDDM